MRKLIFILVFSLSVPLMLLGQFRSGIVVEMADSWVKRQTAMYTRPDDPYTVIWDSDKWHPGFSFSVGYKVQYEVKKYMFDIALTYQNRGIGVTFLDDDEKQTARLQAIGGNIVINRFVWNRLFIGLGVSPVYYWDNRVFNNQQKTYWQFPAMGQLGYDFGVLQVSAFYKHDFKPILEYLNATQRVYMRDLGVSVFVPLKF